MNVGNFNLTPSAKLEAEPQNADLHQLISTFRRRSRVFGAVAAVIFAGVVLVTFQATPRYTATANVMIEFTCQLPIKALTSLLVLAASACPCAMKSRARPRSAS